MGGRVGGVGLSLKTMDGLSSIGSRGGIESKGGRFRKGGRGGEMESVPVTRVRSTGLA